MPHTIQTTLVFVSDVVRSLQRLVSNDGPLSFLASSPSTRTKPAAGPCWCCGRGAEMHCPGSPQVLALSCQRPVSNGRLLFQESDFLHAHAVTREYRD